jgi:hypothetical protein
MVGATAVVATIMAGVKAEATTMVGGTIVIGNLICRSKRPPQLAASFRIHVYRRLGDHVTNRQAHEAADRLVANLEANKLALHPEKIWETKSGG